MDIGGGFVAAPIPNLDFFTPDQLEKLKTAVSAAYFERIAGVVSSGNAGAEGYSFERMSTEDLTRLMNAITDKLNGGCRVKIAPNFNTRC